MHKGNAPIAGPGKYPVKSLDGVLPGGPAPRENVRFPGVWI
jgi:hypothetical protein